MCLYISWVSVYACTFTYECGQTVARTSLGAVPHPAPYLWQSLSSLFAAVCYQASWPADFWGFTWILGAEHRSSHLGSKGFTTPTILLYNLPSSRAFVVTLQTLAELELKYSKDFCWTEGGMLTLPLISTSFSISHSSKHPFSWNSPKTVKNTISCCNSKKQKTKQKTGHYINSKKK